MEETATFEAERTRLVGLASRMLADPIEAEDIVQQGACLDEREDAKP